MQLLGQLWSGALLVQISRKGFKVFTHLRTPSPKLGRVRTFGHTFVKSRKGSRFWRIFAKGSRFWERFRQNAKGFLLLWHRITHPHELVKGFTLLVKICKRFGLLGIRSPRPRKGLHFWGNRLIKNIVFSFSKNFGSVLEASKPIPSKRFS